MRCKWGGLLEDVWRVVCLEIPFEARRDFDFWEV